MAKWSLHQAVNLRIFEPWHHHATLDPLFALNNKKKYSQPEHAFNEKI